MNNVLQEYLVELGFAVDDASFQKFRNVVAQSGATVVSSTSGTLRGILEFQSRSLRPGLYGKPLRSAVTRS